MLLYRRVRQKPGWIVWQGLSFDPFPSWSSSFFVSVQSFLYLKAYLCPPVIMFVPFLPVAIRGSLRAQPEFPSNKHTIKGSVHTTSWFSAILAELHLRTNRRAFGKKSAFKSENPSCRDLPAGAKGLSSLQNVRKEPPEGAPLPLDYSIALS
jgi:hypothetical protein